MWFKSKCFYIVVSICSSAWHQHVFFTMQWWIIQENSWHMAPFKGLMWLDLPGFPPTLPVGSIVPLHETSWLSTVWAHVAAIDGRHTISPTRSRRPPHGCRNHWKDSSTSSQTWPSPGALCTVSKRPIFSPSSSSSTSVDLSYSPPPAHTFSLFIFSFSPTAFWEISVSLSGLVFRTWTLWNWRSCIKPLFPQSGSKSLQGDQHLTEEKEQSRRKMKHFVWKLFFSQAKRSFTLKPL